MNALMSCPAATAISIQQIILFTVIVIRLNHGLRRY